ncbi:hypothetical protein EBR96_09230 [bacterium]|nr:hypothetical protein [bacterium]
MVENMLSVSSMLDRAIFPSQDIFSQTLYNVALGYSVDYFSMLVVHEYYGHGARFREFGVEDSYYLPFRWLSFSEGWAAYQWYKPLNLDQNLLLRASGSESNTLAAIRFQKYLLSDPAFFSEHYYYYLLNKFEQLGYLTRSRDMNGPLVESSDDMMSYYYLLSQKYPNKDINSFYRNSDLLRREALFGTLDIALYASWKLMEWGNSFFSGAGTYSWNLPRLSFLGKPCLFGTWTSLTPWGPEFMVNLDVLEPGHTINTFYIRKSDGNLEQFWGMGFELGSFLRLGHSSCGLGIDIFNQPTISDGSDNRIPIGNQTGFSVSLTPRTQLFENEHQTLEFEGKFTYKTEGYIIGAPFSEGPYCYAGLKYEGI